MSASPVTPKKAKFNVNVGTPESQKNYQVVESEGYLHRVHSTVQHDDGKFFKFCFQSENSCVEGSCYLPSLQAEFSELCNNKTPVVLKGRKQFMPDGNVRAFYYNEIQPPKKLQSINFDYSVCEKVKKITVSDIQDVLEKTSVYLHADILKKLNQINVNGKFIDIYELRNGEELGVLKVWEPKNDLVFGQYEIRGKVKTYKDEAYIEVILFFFSVHNSLLQF